MAYYLYIESATAIGGVALYQDAQLVGCMEYHRANTHAEMLTPMIHTLLTDLKVAGKEIAAIGVSKGPGSYTGLRVGVSTAKGLCAAWDVPLLSVGSLEALAAQVRTIAAYEDAWICPMIDARRMEVYCGFYDANLMEMRQIEAEIIGEKPFEEILSQRKVIFVGDGALKCAQALSYTQQAIVLPHILASVKSIGDLLHASYLNQKFEDCVSFEPYYLKDYVATTSKKTWV